ncbi:MAG: Gfo/Idh/MocA family oxidoreductase [Acidobacteria bacterium]|nr:Gfo/Idh/MocA family oxidoreductase [Acidobacteriota bacterium]
MPEQIRWGVIGVAKIATVKVIPAMKKSPLTPVVAIASRNLDRARQAAAQLGIAKAYGSYEDLLADPEIDAVYNPLPNHLHVPLSVAAARAGKHVLCEKPIALSSEETLELIRARDETGVKVGEAFMARTHPQWLRARSLVREGAIGRLNVMAGFFSYFNNDPANIRNRVEWGGGGLMDIGCYPITLSRLIYGREPARVLGLVERDPEMQVDRLASVLMDYAPGQCVFTCSTQQVAFQRVQLLGTRGRIELDIPFNAPIDRPARLLIDDGSSLFGYGSRIEEIPTCDQYTIQGDLFSRAILDNTEVPVPLEDSIANMRVIEAIFRSTETGAWTTP